MNTSLLILELAVVVLGLALVLLDLWTLPSRKPYLGYGAAAALLVLLIYSLVHFQAGPPQYAFGHTYVLDGLALFFKRFFLVAAILVLLMGVEFADRFKTGVAEFYALVLFALCGMMLAASANDLTTLFVSLELITVSFYILTSFERHRLTSLEAGIKYLILGALSTSLTVYGIALVYGSSGTMSFEKLAQASALQTQPLFILGLLLVLAGLAFKISIFPMQVWAPDVYQGAPSPVTAFLAVGSKAAGFALLLRVLFAAVPQVTGHWTRLLIALSIITILYGNLCAIPQRNLKRLLGYSSIAHAGYLLLGVAAMSAAGQNTGSAGSAILYYLSGYLFTVLAAFTVLVVVIRAADAEDISGLAGLQQRSPLMATAITLAMVSLAGIPPLAGFFGKFLLFKAALEQGSTDPLFFWLLGVALVGVVISIYFYFGVVRVVYWSSPPPQAPPVALSLPLRLGLYACLAGMLYLGILPGPMVRWAGQAVADLKPAVQTSVRALPLQ